MAPIQLIEESEVLRRLDKAQVLESLSTAFAGLNNGRGVQPAQTVTAFPDDLGDCIFSIPRPSRPWVDRSQGVPLPWGVGRGGKYPVTAYSSCCRPATVATILLCDSYLSSRWSGRRHCSPLFSISPGTMLGRSPSSVRARSSRSIFVSFSEKAGPGKAFVCSRHRHRPRRASGSPHQRVPRCRPSPSATTAADAVRDADVVMLCTSSGTPVVERNWIGPKALVTSSAPTCPEHMRSIPPGSRTSMCSVTTGPPLRSRLAR